MEKVDAVVIGAGVIGLAIARALARDGRDVIVVESEKMIGSVTSARNSGVIHAGIYYQPGSAKAKYCVHGKGLLYDYVKDKNIPHKNCGKLIVATTPEEVGKLHNIRENALLNGVNDLTLISANDAKRMEPEVSCHAALYSPSTGIIDVHAYLLALLVDFENMGGTLALKNTVIGGEITDKGIVLQLNDIDTPTIIANTVINAAGLGAQQVAAALKNIPVATLPPLYLAKGNYFSISGPSPFQHLVYPVPVPGGLGAHFTMNMAGESLFGPDVEWLHSDEFHNYDVNHTRAQSFYESIARYWPGITQHTLTPAYSGIRPKISPRGGPDQDFLLQSPSDHGIPGLVNLFGIESPGLTSSLAIAEDVVKLVT